MVDMVAAVLAKKAEKIKRYPCKSNRASGLGYFVPELEGCLRRGVYERTRWQEKELISPELQLIFDEGNNQEMMILRDLADAGIPIIEQQTMYEWPDYQITGHIDGKLVDGERAIPVEIKSMSPNIFSQVRTFEDFKKKPWTRAYMAQATMYMLMQNIDEMVFILKNKSTGALRQINCGLDYELGEFCIRAAEQINKHVADDTLPDRITDRQKCADCPYKLICLPDVNFGEPLKITDDPDFEKRVERYLELKNAAEESKKLWDTIKVEAKAQAGETGELNMMIGKYHLTGKNDSRGAFRLKIEGLDG